MPGVKRKHLVNDSKTSCKRKSDHFNETKYTAEAIVSQLLSRRGKVSSLFFEMEESNSDTFSDTTEPEVSSKPEDIKWDTDDANQTNQSNFQYLENPVLNASRIQQNTDNTFEFNAENIIAWIEKLKKFNEQHNTCLPKYFLRYVLEARLAVFMNLHILAGLPSEERKAIMEAFWEIDEIYQHHFRSMCLHQQ